MAQPRLEQRPLGGWLLRLLIIAGPCLLVCLLTFSLHLVANGSYGAADPRLGSVSTPRLVRVGAVASPEPPAPPATRAPVQRAAGACRFDSALVIGMRGAGLKTLLEGVAYPVREKDTKTIALFISL